MFRLVGQFLLMLHCFYSFQDRGNCPFCNECILNVYIKVYMRCLMFTSMLDPEKIFERKQLPVLPPGYPACDVAKASLL